MMTSSAEIASIFINKLKSRTDNARIKGAKELLRYVNGEMKENSSLFVEDFLNRFDYGDNSVISELVSSYEAGERKAGIFIIVCLTEANANLSESLVRINRFSNYLLRKAILGNDNQVIELAAKAVAYIAITFKVYAAELVEKALSMACEWLEDTDRSQGSRHSAAVLLSRELAFSTPTFFFQKAGKFFEHIFKVIRDPKPVLRQDAVTALRAALVVTSQRETKQKTKTQWYSMCFNEAETCFKEAEQTHGSGREDKLHSGLLIYNELLRIANREGERQRQEAEELNREDTSGDKIKLVQTSGRKHTYHSASSVHSHFGAEDVIDWLITPSHPTTLESRTCRRMVTEKFNMMCEFTLSAKASQRSPYVQQVLLELLPRLAAFDQTGVFSARFLPDTLHYVLSCLNRDKDKGKPFLALGLLAIVTKDDIKPHVSRIFDGIRSCLPGRDKKKSLIVDPTVFTCLTLLIQALKSDLEYQIRQILQAMFATGLSSGLTIALREAAKCIPSLRVDIQEGLLQQLSIDIMHKSMPNRLAPPPQLDLPTSPVLVENKEKTVLALKTLGSFQFPRHSLEMFLKYIAHGYLSSDISDVRLATVQCCCRLLIPFVMLLDRSLDKQQQQNMKLLTMIHEVMGKLLAVAVVDPEAEVRLCVFECLSETKTHFAFHLAQPEMLERIFMGLQDESYDIQEAVVCLLGKLGDINPAYVMPTLRRVVIQIISQLNNSGLSRLQEQGARMLAQLASHSPKFMKPYMQSVLKTLIPKLRKGNRQLDVVVAVLNAIGELAKVGGPELVECLEQLMPIFIEFIQDSSSLPKREMALWAMGQVIQNTGYVLEPYRKNPELLDILMRFLKSEQSPSMRRETIRVLGIIGALDPYQHKVFMGSVESAANATSLAVSMPEAKDSNDPRQEIVQWFNYERCTLEEFYPAFAVANLMHIVSDPALTDIHKEVIQAVITIFRSLGPKCIPFVNQVVPRFIPVIKDCRKDVRGQSWSDDDTNMRQTITSIVEEIGRALGYEFKPFVPELTPYFMRVLYRDDSRDRVVTGNVLKAFQVCVLSLEEHLHLIIPPIIRLFDAQDVPINVRCLSVQTLCTFTEFMSLAQFGPRILHALIRVLTTQSLEFRNELIKLLLALVKQMGKDFVVFRPVVEQTFTRNKIEIDKRYDLLINQIEQDGGVYVPVQAHHKPSRQIATGPSTDTPNVEPLAKQHINTTQLKKTWISVRDGNLVSKEDWTQWLSNFRVQLLKQSPYSALRACGQLAELHEPLARDLFNAAFMSVWTELNEDNQNDLSRALEDALNSSDHSEIVQTILNLAEFMDHSEKGPLPISWEELGRCAYNTRAYAKALRYREQIVLMQKEVLPADCEALITLANKLQLQEEAVGVVEFAKEKKISIETKGRWYEKLHQWEKALILYEMQQSTSSESPFELTQHRLRCLEALGDWTKLHGVVREAWEEANEQGREKLAVMAAKGAWGVGDWIAMEEYVASVSKNEEDGTFLRGVLAVHNAHYRLARQMIDRCRELIDTDLTSVAAESYERAYGVMVTVQRLSELEEAIQFKLMPERRSAIAQIWWSRLQGCRENVEDWQKFLLVRSLVLNPTEMRQAWMKFASLCRRNDVLSMSRRILSMLIINHGGSITPQNVMLPPDKPDLSFAFAKQLWREGETQGQAVKREEAFEQLKRLVDANYRALPRPQQQHQQTDDDVMIMKLNAKCFLKLGQWFEQLPTDCPTKRQQQGTEPIHAVSLKYYRSATELDNNWYKAFHCYASCNFALTLHYRQQLTVLQEQPQPQQLSPLISQHHQTSPHASLSIVPVSDSELSPLPSMTLPHSSSVPHMHSPLQRPSKKDECEQHMNTHAELAVKCFFRAINLCRANRLQDTLRLLTLWFDYGQNVAVYDALVDGLQNVPVETWLQVIPQLIARIDTPRSMVARLIKQQLTEIGKAHPQALVYPLTVASKSTNKKRQQVADHLLKQMTQHSRVLVSQARMVSEELIRVAILWHELWHEGLEEASRQYFQDRNVKGMFATLEPLHNMIEAGPTTLKEQSFHQTYYRDLTEAREWCERYKCTGNVKELTQAWDLYYVCFKRISKQLPQLTHLELQYVSPSLLMARDLELAVPGTYDPSRSLIRIQSMHTSLQVITSKQRPRKVCIKGSDGQDYWFCLKGHEDPRQDERVMQLFGLVNTLLLQEPATCRRNLTIQRYSIVPLSQNSGLIGWVPNSDTLHTLLRDYREKKKILLNIEHRLMQRMSQDFDKLTLIQKVEVFEHALEHTAGDDLQKILWLKSPSSEVWFDRRTNYTRSLATMSMVGYILGLGDRHPSNLMLDRMSGKIVHIDFGDCFEVAMTREKFPEKIPFRLTRMLEKAMEVTGIEGNFKITCERVMRVLRNNRESLLAVLEAFVYDPLINWRLLDQGGKRTQPPEMSSVLTGDQDELNREIEEVQQGTVGGAAVGRPDELVVTETVSNKAVQVIQRIRDKLDGKDFLTVTGEPCDVKDQVTKLIEQAVSHENLCQCYIGWCPFW